MTTSINNVVFHQFPVIKTERLTLRDIRIDDANEIYAMRSSGRVGQFIPRPLMSGDEDAKQLVERTRAAYENKQGIGWAGILRNNEAIIGTCGYNTIDFLNHRAEIGGEMNVNYWGKNIALEAVSAIVMFGLEKMYLHSIEARLSPENRGALFLLETLGFEKEAHFKERVFFNGRYSDMVVYTLIKGREKYFSDAVVF